MNDVPKVVWDAVHGDEVDYTVGKLAKQMKFMQRWFPRKLRKRIRSQGVGIEI